MCSCLQTCRFLQYVIEGFNSFSTIISDIENSLVVQTPLGVWKNATNVQSGQMRNHIEANSVPFVLGEVPRARRAGVGFKYFSIFAASKTKFLGVTVLHWGAKYGNAEIIKIFAGKYKVNVNGKTGYTPLHISAQFDHRNIFKLLIEVYKADTKIRDYSGRTAEYYLLSKEQKENSQVTLRSEYQKRSSGIKVLTHERPVRKTKSFRNKPISLPTAVQLNPSVGGLFQNYPTYPGTSNITFSLVCMVVVLHDIFYLLDLLPNIVKQLMFFLFLRKTKGRKKQSDKDLGFLRIGSLNVRVKKTTEAFSNFLGVGNSGSVNPINSTSEEVQKGWGSADNISKDCTMQPPKGVFRKKSKRAADSGLSSTPSTPRAPVKNYSTSSLPLTHHINDSDSDNAAGFDSNWQN
ncbi:hypothetical protein HUJ05_009272 [Dendroctonus ponderosae]|nr:hypothetical protein HUJ05_009272 [Dendroctonus ponderosae]